MGNRRNLEETISNLIFGTEPAGGLALLGSMEFLTDTKIAVWAFTGNVGNIFPATDFKGNN